MDTVSLVFPTDDRWDSARQAWNLTVDQQPAAVALPGSPDEVAQAVRFARQRGLRVVPQSTGHSATPLGDLSDALLVKTARLRDVRIDPQTRTARAGGGALWMDVTRAAAPHGLAALAGTSADVGVAGNHLGGGISWLARKHGLATNSLTAVELVTADGTLVRPDADTEPDLFWALRGGGGNFGVVTALEFRLVPISEVYAGALFFPAERLREVLHAWREWTESVPDELMSVGRFMQFPPNPNVPEPFRGRSFALVEAAFIGSRADGEELLRPLRELTPALDTVSMIPVQTLDKLHMDPEQPVPGVGDGMLLADLPSEAIDAVAELLGRGSSLVSVEFRHLGGELANARRENGALASVEASFSMFAVGSAMTPELAVAVESEVGYVQHALAAHDAGRMYMNFADKPRTGRALFGAAYHRLREVKAAYDPEDVFKANHPVPPAQQPRPPRAVAERPERALVD